MTITRNAQLRSPTTVGRRSAVQRALLLCGVLSSLLYAATDVLAGLAYHGYDFTSQAVSELMAVGAPSEPFVDPLFLLYGVLVLLCGIGLLREGSRRNRALTITGALLIAYAIAGSTGPTLFEMSQRGSGGPGSDFPHIIVTGVLSLLLLLAMGFGAFALDRKFRVYSFATMATTIGLGIVMVPFAARLAAGQPTPGLGIIERMSIYATLMWIAVLCVMLLRRTAESASIRSARSHRRVRRAAFAIDVASVPSNAAHRARRRGPFE